MEDINRVNNPATSSSTLVKRENLSTKDTTQYIFSTMMSFASRPAADDNAGFLCEIGEVASITATAFCGGDTDSTRRATIKSSPTAQKLRSSITKNSSFSKLASKIATKTKTSKSGVNKSDLNSPATASSSALPSSAPGNNIYTSTHSNGSSLHGQDSLHSSLALEVGKSAHEYLEECLVTEVSILDRDKFNAVPEYHKDQLNIAEHLGKGSYSDVFEVAVNVSIFDEKSDSIDDLFIERMGDLSLSTTGPSPPAHQKKQDANTKVARDDITSTGRRPPRARRVTFTSSVRQPVIRPNRCDERQVIYAMKCLRPQIRSDAEQFIIGAEDLVHETALLATLDHPNIIKVHGRAAGKLKDAFTLNDGYFILLDRLKKETLKDYIGDWWRYPEFYLHGPTVRQIDIALSIAEAISYLHSKNIVYRDLKPANVGFDSQGVVKLFDFGFAMGLPALNSADKSNPAGLLFDKCGTPRYMSPEVGLEIGYRTEADVYSYGILLWEMCSLNKPFAEYKTADEFEQAVFIRGVRPSMKKHWPRLLRETIDKCWSKRPSQRPSMESVESVLREVKTSLSGGEGGGERRRTSYSRATRRLSINMGHGYILG
eukprot:scaffold355_cov127-Skeletonema_dohrnii-CCMP3373.AAC.13